MAGLVPEAPLLRYTPLLRVGTCAVTKEPQLHPRWRLQALAGDVVGPTLRANVVTRLLRVDERSHRSRNLRRTLQSGIGARAPSPSQL